MKNHKPIYILLIVIFSLLFLIPIWSVKYIPLQDWPVFMGISYIISHFSHFHSYFAVKPIPPPYSTGFLLLAGLMRIFPPLVAGKVLLSIYIITFFASFYYFLRILNPEGLYLYFFAPLLVFNYFFGKGNINFILSIPLFLFLIPVFSEKISGKRLFHIPLAFLLSLVLYFTHFFTYFIFLLVLLIIVLYNREKFVLFAVSCIPLILFAAYFLINRAPVGISFYKSFYSKFLSFRDVFGTWTPYIDVLILVVPFLLLFFFVLKGWKVVHKKWKIILLLFLLVFLFAPEEVYTLSRPDQRILPFAFFTLLLFPVIAKKPRFKFVFSLVIIILSLVNFEIKEKTFITLNRDLEKCVGVLSKVPMSKSVVSIGTKNYYTGVVNPFLHIIYYSIPTRNNANIPSYEWNIPLFYKLTYPKPEIASSVIKNKHQLLTFYDYFFVMEDGKDFENQLKMFADLVYANENVKLFEKK